ncbi:hypothetical protein B0H11DRAFT_2259130 [Mycena galericulata]|nr:hypothetical protein B0H11DRAFT_2259130 [Mycena galericulata]
MRLVHPNSARSSRAPAPKAPLTAFGGGWGSGQPWAPSSSWAPSTTSSGWGNSNEWAHVTWPVPSGNWGTGAASAS